MTQSDRDLLREQLLEALDDEASVEALALAALLARLEPGDPLVAQALAAAPSPGELDGPIDAALDALLGFDPEDGPELGWDALCLADELAAALHLAGDARTAGFLEAAIGAISAFPEDWAAHADAAGELLRRGAVPPDEPAAVLWAAVEACRYGLEPEAERELPWETLRALGLPVVIPIGAWRARVGADRLAADAGVLSPPPPWDTVARGEGWELALTDAPDGAPILLLTGPRAAAAELARDGAPVATADDPEGRTCPALPGRWTLQVDGQARAFEIAP